MIRLLHVTVAVISITLLSATHPHEASADQPTGAYIVAVNNPLAYFAERLAGVPVAVRLPLLAVEDDRETVASPTASAGDDQQQRNDPTHERDRI